MEKTFQVLIGLLFIPMGLAAQNPWATQVVSYVGGTAPFPSYDVTASALGRPTVETYQDITETTPSVVVVPAYPPWEFDELISIGEGGSLVLQMGMPITDDPQHPYGVDLLVFGNALVSGSGLYDQEGNDPRTYTFSATPTLESKWGVVSVSVDGIIWFSFPDDQRVGALMPTLGKIWTGTAWGEETDPTIPPDPSLTLADLANLNLADLCIRYRGGAGGTGFDLADLIIPEGVTPPTSFIYVKISVPDDGNELTNHRTEIDAVTVVSPVGGFTRWQQENFAWSGDPALEAPDANEDQDVYDNWQEYARGGDPGVEETVLPTPSLSSESGGFFFELPASAVEAPWILQSTATPQDTESWSRLDPQPEYVDTAVGGNVNRYFEVPAPQNGVFLYRLRLEDSP